MAKASYREGLRLWHEMQQVEQRLGIVKGLAGLAEIAAAQGRAGRLFGVASRLLPATSTSREEVLVAGALRLVRIPMQRPSRHDGLQDRR